MKNGKMDAKDAKRPTGVVVIIGACGSGKTSLGQYLVNKCLPYAVFIEGDDYHPPENVAKMSQGIL